MGSNPTCAATLSSEQARLPRLSPSEATAAPSTPAFQPPRHRAVRLEGEVGGELARVDVLDVAGDPGLEAAAAVLAVEVGRHLAQLGVGQAAVRVLVHDVLLVALGDARRDLRPAETQHRGGER